MRSAYRRDALLITFAKGLRAIGYGLLSVALGLHLPAIGLSPGQTGAVFTALLLGSAILTAAFAATADRLGRRRVLAVSAGLLIVSGLLFALVRRFEWLILISLLGALSPTSGEVGPFETLEQTILPQMVSAERRNRLFGWYNSAGALMTAFGALLVAAPGWLGIPAEAGFAWAFWVYSLLGLAVLVCYLLLSPAIELQAAKGSEETRSQTLSLSSRPIIFKLAGLFGVDALAGGFVVQSLIVLWFNLRFGAGASILGPLFAAVELIKALSYLIAVRLADRVGLINTMVFSHLPSNVLLMCIPLMPNLPLAMTVLLLRHTLSQMDVPTRQSYVVAIVPPRDRTAANGITNVTRTIARMISPAISGLALQIASQGLPFFLGGGLKILYDLGLYFNFRSVVPEDEASRQ